tara:strand:+ start:2631 stop:2798 length:168 start_codon:yes stop_codon:yes gene_type:complete
MLCINFEICPFQGTGKTGRKYTKSFCFSKGYEKKYFYKSVRLKTKLLINFARTEI